MRNGRSARHISPKSILKKHLDHLQTVPEQATRYTLYVELHCTLLKRVQTGTNRTISEFFHKLWNGNNDNTSHHVAGIRSTRTRMKQQHGHCASCSTVRRMACMRHQPEERELLKLTPEMGWRDAKPLHSNSSAPYVECPQPLDRERHLVANLQPQVRGGKVNKLPPSVLVRPVLPPPPSSDSLTTELWKRRGRFAAATSPRCGGPRL